MPVNLTVTFAPEIKQPEQQQWHPLDIVGAQHGAPVKFVARMCCSHAHLVAQGNDVVTCCHAGHPAFMIRDGKVIGTSA